jgi:putative membrane protein
VKPSILLILLLAVPLGACRRDGRAPDEATGADTLRTGQHAVLSDAEVLHALIAATEIGAATAARAVGRAEHVDVEVYAQVMQADHSALQQEFAGLAYRIGVQPAPNEVSQRLQQEGNQKLARMENLEGLEFDRAYVGGGVEFYQALVEAYDARLLPSAREPQLREVMRAAKPTLEAHLQRAAQLRAQLEGVQPLTPGTDPAALPPPGQPAPPAAQPQPQPQPPAAPPDTTPVNEF